MTGSSLARSIDLHVAPLGKRYIRLAANRSYGGSAACARRLRRNIPKGFSGPAEIPSTGEAHEAGALAVSYVVLELVQHGSNHHPLGQL